MKTIEEIQQERADRKAARSKAEATQVATDLEFVNALEVEHGDENIATLRVPFTDGLPVMIAVRAPKPALVKRYRARIKGKDADLTAAAEEVGKSCLVYPDPEVFEQIATLRPGITSQLGAEALRLIVGAAESEGKD